jgi:hypothetical protein
VVGFQAASDNNIPSKSKILAFLPLFVHARDLARFYVVVDGSEPSEIKLADPLLGKSGNSPH